MNKIDIACIIDDDPIFIFGAKRVMELASFCNSILIYHNGKEALDMLTMRIASGTNLPEVIFLDLNMPIMDGWQFLDKFIQIPTTKKIIIYIISSSIDPADFEKAKKYDEVSNYIVKPITVDKLKEILAAV